MITVSRIHEIQHVNYVVIYFLLYNGKSALQGSISDVRDMLYNVTSFPKIVTKQALSKGTVLIRLHGGGFVKPYRGQDVNYSHVVAYNTKCLLIDVDYKPAPEKAYPYAVNEGYAVVKYL